MSEYVNCDSHKEENVAIKDRVFMIEGKVPTEIVNAIRSKIPETLMKQEKRLEKNYVQSLNQLAENYFKLFATATQEHYFISFAYADIFVGKTFEIAFPYNNPKEGIKCKAIIKAILQEHLLVPIDFVDCGHRSICLIDFPDGIPIIISQMKQVTHFMQTKLSDMVFLCNQHTWEQWLS